MIRIHLLLLAVLAATVAAPRAQALSYALVERGKYLVDAGDCIVCHTRAHGQPFAGGRPVPTPFGTIYSANITPDRGTGIGEWSDEDFYRALHYGVRPTGQRLYPAFPYPYFTRMTRDDVRAIHAYLKTLDPVSYKPPPNELSWVVNRFAMRFWNFLNFTPGAYRPDPKKSAEWNRGAYLVEGPGHCGACHTPKNLIGADENDRALTGGKLQNWFAPQLSGNQPHGLANWTTDEIVAYLKTGRNARTGATGLMAEVIENSTSKLTDSDLRAIALYLKDGSGPATKEGAAPDQALENAGAAIYADQCAACHQQSGAGIPGMFPQLKNSAVVQQRDPTTVLRVILEGARTATTAARPTPSTMPAFDWKLNDEEVAAVASYVRSAWGNHAGRVKASAVNDLRKALNSKAAHRE